MSTNWSIRRLDSNIDEPLFRTMFTWLEQSPSWRRETEAVFGTLDLTEYLAATHWDRRIDVGVFVGSTLIACVTMTLTAKDTYEVHFEASRQADPAVVVAAGRVIRDQMFAYGTQLAYTYTPRWNRTVLAINNALGFRPSGVIMLRGTCRGRLIEWLQYQVKNPYGRQQTENTAATAAAV